MIFGNKRFVNRKKIFEAGSSELIPDAVSFIEDALSGPGIDRRLVLRTVLTAEEVITRLAAHTEEGGSVSVRIKRLVGDAVIEISSRGEELSLTDVVDSDIISMEDEEAERSIRSIILNSMSDTLKYSYKAGINRVRILTGQTDRSSLQLTIMALVLGIVLGLILRTAAPDAFAAGLCTYLFEPVKTMFMSALKIVIAPVVFFSIVSCIAQFRNLAELGRIGAKVMGMYLLTTVAAIVISMSMSHLLHPGRIGFALGMDTGGAGAGIETDVDTSLLHTIVNIIPSNLVRPFLEADTIQIIFLAVLIGVAVGMIGEYAPVLQEFFSACNSLFLTVTTMISRFIPLAVLCSVTLMLVQMEADSFVSILGMAGTYLLCIFCMLIVYGLLVWVLGRLDPLIFYRKNREGMITSFTLSSSSAAMPTNMRTCTDKLGVSPKVCSFSIPLGATVNMDGTCVILTVAGLFMARAYGVGVHGSMYFSLLLTIVLLSLGAPGVPGSGLVCLGVVLGGLGVPVEAIGLIIGIYPFIDMTNTISNTTGDVATAAIVASSEGLLDRDIYYDTKAI